MYEQLIASPAINQDAIDYTEGGAVRKEILSRTFTMRDFVHAAVRCWLDLWLLFAAAMSVLCLRYCMHGGRAQDNTPTKQLSGGEHARA
eukprot:COSAG01_NODE_103_length_26263_cov_31.957728_15_plen_89_part_00